MDETYAHWLWKVTDQTSVVATSQSFSLPLTHAEVIAYLTERYPTAPGFNAWPQDDN